jgi:hypothetical protein
MMLQPARLAAKGSYEGCGSVELTTARGNGRTRTAVNRRLVRLLVLRDVFKSDEGCGSVELTTAHGNGRTRTAVSRRLVRLLVVRFAMSQLELLLASGPLLCKGEDEESEREGHRVVSNATPGSDDDND